MLLQDYSDFFKRSAPCPSFFLDINLPFNYRFNVINIDEFVKSRIHQVFGVSYLVFDMKYMMLYRHVRILNTKYQIQNTLVKRLLF